MTSIANSPLEFSFIVPSESNEQFAALRELGVDDDWQYFTQGTHIWCLQTYLILKAHGVNVRTYQDYVHGCVNIVHAAQVPLLKPRPDVFVVSVQADYPRVWWADLHVVQNRAQEREGKSYWVPHWPQPGLIPREPHRDGVRVVAFGGNPCWLALRKSRWRAALADHDLEFRFLGPSNWNDFSDVDVLLAVRSFDGRTYDDRPPSKLFNSWLAGIPMIGGADSAFEQVGRPGIDYIQVTSFEETLREILRLRREPQYYQRIVDAGAARAAEFSRETIARHWESLLENPIGAAFDAWKDRGASHSGLWHMKMRSWMAYRRCRLHLGKLQDPARATRIRSLRADRHRWSHASGL